MINLRKILNITTVAAALGLVVLVSAPSSALAFEHFRHFHSWHSHWLSHWHWHSHWRSHFHYAWHSHWEHRFHWRRGYHWAYHFGGYRPVVVEAPRVCPPGTHLGHLGKFCWPNR